MNVDNRIMPLIFVSLVNTKSNSGSCSSLTLLGKRVSVMFLLFDLNFWCCLSFIHFQLRLSFVFVMSFIHFEFLPVSLFAPFSMS